MPCPRKRKQHLARTHGQSVSVIRWTDGKTLDSPLRIPNVANLIVWHERHVCRTKIAAVEKGFASDACESLYVCIYNSNAIQTFVFTKNRKGMEVQSVKGSGGRSAINVHTILCNMIQAYSTRLSSCTCIIVGLPVNLLLSM